MGEALLDAAAGVACSDQSAPQKVTVGTLASLSVGPATSSSLPFPLSFSGSIVWGGGGGELLPLAERAEWANGHLVQVAVWFPTQLAHFGQRCLYTPFFPHSATRQVCAEVLCFSPHNPHRSMLSCGHLNSECPQAAHLSHGASLPSST